MERGAEKETSWNSREMVMSKIAWAANCISNNALVRASLYSLLRFITRPTATAGNFPTGSVLFSRCFQM